MDVMSSVLVAIDPGPSHTGYAVLSPFSGTAQEHTLHRSGTWIPAKRLSTLDRHLWLLSKLQDFLAEWLPATLAYEEFTWQVGDEGEHFLRGRPAMERFIGGLQALTLFPPFPVLMPLLPQVWGKQFVGSASHTKADVARVVNLRLGTSYDGGVYSNHESDAVAIGLVALDTLRMHSQIQASRFSQVYQGRTR